MKHSVDVKPQVTSSDVTTHTKIEIACYVYEKLSELPATVKILKIWSDGPNNQFKNKYIASLIPFFEEMFKIKIVWNFFAASHGKGCVDGIGSVVKNKVKRLVKSRKGTVYSSSDFVSLFNTEPSLIKVIDMPKSQIDQIRSKLKLDELFDKAPNVKGIFNFHQLKTVNCKVIGFDMSYEGYDKVPL